MIVRYLVASALVLSMVAIGWFFSLPDERPAPSHDVERASVTELEQNDDLRPQPLPAETERLAPVRQVIPGRAVHAPAAGEDVVRLPAPPITAPPPRPVSLGIVVVEAANKLSTRRGMVRLHGTRAIDEDAICRLDDGRAPACHVLARTAVRRFIGQRQVSCVLSLREDASEDHVAPCTLADADLALWVVGHGWAFADGSADADLQEVQSLARREQRGLWGLLTGDRIDTP